MTLLSQVAFLNIFGARLWHDLHNSKGFVDLLREKITRKLLKVKVRCKVTQVVRCLKIKVSTLLNGLHISVKLHVLHFMPVH